MKKKLVLIFLLVAAAIIGGFAATAFEGVTYFDWLSYSKNIGIQPFTVEAVSISFTFGFSISLSVAQIILLIIALIVYPKLAKSLDA